VKLIKTCRLIVETLKKDETPTPNNAATASRVRPTAIDISGAQDRQEPADPEPTSLPALFPEEDRSNSSPNIDFRIRTIIASKKHTHHNQLEVRRARFCPSYCGNLHSFNDAEEPSASHSSPIPRWVLQ
jgi:hypothetical protein